jgi:tetratricopeptide (TPR) repeat protein
MLVLGLSCATADAAERASFKFSDDGGYERIVIEFDTLPAYEIKANDSVLIVSFDRPVDVGNPFKELDRQKYIVAGRLDPDGTAVRFALTEKLSVNTIEAGDRLFIDLLPQTWQGAPPRLPQEVIANLAERARIAEKAVRREALLRKAEERDRKVVVRIGENPTFTRISFDWPSPPIASLSREDNRITIAFDQIAKPMIGQLKADPPRFVRSTDFSIDEDGLKVIMTVEAAMDVRAFREGNSYIVDIADPMGVGITGDVAARLEASRTLRGDARAGITQMYAERRGDPAVAAPDESGTGQGGGETARGLSPGAERQDGASSPETGVPDAGGIPSVVITERPLDHNGDPLPDDAQQAEKAKVPAPEAQPPAADLPALSEADPESGAAPDAAASNGKVVGEAADEAEHGTQAAREAETVRSFEQALDEDPDALRFTFSTPTAAAVFVRGDALWMAFEGVEAPDLGQISASTGGVFGTPRLLRSDNLQVVRVPLRSSAEFVAVARGNSWSIGIASRDKLIAKTVHLVPNAHADGRFNVTARVEGAHEVHWIDDPVVGDQIAVITVGAGTPVTAKEQVFVEFASIETAAGLAFKAYSDDVTVQIDGPNVLIAKQDGLTLSATAGIEARQKIVAGRDDQKPAGLVDFGKWALGGPEEFLDRVEQLELGVAMLPRVQAAGLRRELTQLYLANELAAEAIGQLKLMSRDDPDTGKKPGFLAMRGIANVMLHRPEEARGDLDQRGLVDEPTIMLWRAYLEAQSENWGDALAAFRRAEKIIPSYPEDLQVRFRLAAARAAVESGDWAKADSQIKALPQHDIGAAAEADAQVLRARMLEGVGRAPEALVAYRKAMDSGDRHAEAESTYFHTTLALRLGDITSKQAIDRYEAASVMWRGDTLELLILRKLAELYVAESDHRRGLEIMKMAVTSFPGTQLAREILDEMNMVFRGLYLDGGADSMSPIKALSLYYDFRELTPVGRLGDEMIRRLADRLIAVDLLDKAVEILAHQIDKRLTGAARAQVAAKLAAVHMMNRQPQEALEVIRRTRQAVLPSALLLRRRMLEARALTEVGQARQAIDLLGDFTGPEVERVRADAFWKSEDWQLAGESYERLLEAAAVRDGPVTDDERLDVMRSAIAYSMADDMFGLARFREKFAVKMAQTPDASAFDAVTMTIDRRTLQFRNLAKAVASIDTLDRFLGDFRKSLDNLDYGGEAKATGS